MWSRHGYYTIFIPYEDEWQVNKETRPKSQNKFEIEFLFESWHTGPKHILLIMGA